MMNYYEILGLPRNASHGEIKRAYRKLAVKYHPDKHLGDRKFEALLKDINVAYETLSEPQSRVAYNLTLSQAEEVRTYAQHVRPTENSFSSKAEPVSGSTNQSIAVSPFDRFKAVFFLALAVVFVLWLLSSLTNTESPNDPSRPKSGELNFKDSK